MSLCLLPSPLQGPSQWVNGAQALCHTQPQSSCSQSGYSELILGGVALKLGKEGKTGWGESFKKERWVRRQEGVPLLLNAQKSLGLIVI